MRVLLISANAERLNMPAMPIGLGFVASAARKAGHDVRFLDLMFNQEPEASIQRVVAEHRPGLIGISVRNVDDQNLASPRFLLEQVRDVVAMCRRSTGVPIVLGGAGFSIFPDAVLDYLDADYGVRGDGERAFVLLLDRLEQGRDVIGLPGVHCRGRGETIEPVWNAIDPQPNLDPDWLAAVDPETPDLWVPVQGRRGCPNDCSYCSTRRIQGRRIRLRPSGAVVEEIENLASRGFRRFYFVDNAFNMPESHGLAICRLLAERRLPVRWRCILYPHKVSEEFVAAIAGAGCCEVSMGFESGSETVLRQLNKHFTPEMVRKVNDLLRRYNIGRVGFLLLGGPGETRETVEQSLAFASSLDLDALRITVGIRIYPGTPLAAVAVEQGVIAPDDPLLEPRFYLAPGLAPWIHERVTPGMYNCK